MFIYGIPGPFAEAKRDEEKRAARSSQAFTEQLRQMFAQQFAHQNEILGFLETHLKPLMSDPQGFFPGEEAALRTESSETVSREYENAARQWQNRAFQLGFRELPSGAMLSSQLALDAARAGAEASGQRQISLTGANLKRTNFFNAAAILRGGAEMLNPLGYASVANQAGDISYKQIKDANQGFSWGKLLAAIAAGALAPLSLGMSGALVGLGAAGGAAMGAATSGSPRMPGTTPSWNPNPTWNPPPVVFSGGWV